MAAGASIELAVVALLAAAVAAAAAVSLGGRGSLLGHFGSVGSLGAVHRHGHDGHDGNDAVVVKINEKTKHRAKSSSSSSNSSNDHLLVERKQWNRQHVDAGDTQKLVSNSKVFRKEAGASSEAEASSRGADNSKVFKDSLTVNGKTAVANEKGSSDSFEETHNSSTSSQFEKSVEAEIMKQVVQQRLDLGCIAERRLNVFVLLHLGSSWKQQLRFLRRLVEDAYEPGRVNFVFVLFNEITDSFATFGPGSFGSRAALLRKLRIVELNLKAQEMMRMTQHWSQFDLRSALSSCFSYAASMRSQWPQLYSRPTLLLSYFDCDADVPADVADVAGGLFNDNRSHDPFQLRVNILQPGANAGKRDAWKQLAAVMSSSQQQQLAYPQEAKLLAFMAQLVSRVCAAQFFN